MSALRCCNSHQAAMHKGSTIKKEPAYDTPVLEIEDTKKGKPPNLGTVVRRK